MSPEEIRLFVCEALESLNCDVRNETDYVLSVKIPNKLSYFFDKKKELRLCFEHDLKSADKSLIFVTPGSRFFNELEQALSTHGRLAEAICLYPNALKVSEEALESLKTQLTILNGNISKVERSSKYQTYLKIDIKISFYYSEVREEIIPIFLNINKSCIEIPEEYIVGNLYEAEEVIKVLRAKRPTWPSIEQIKECVFIAGQAAANQALDVFPYLLYDIQQSVLDEVERMNAFYAKQIGGNYLTGQDITTQRIRDAQVEEKMAEGSGRIHLDPVAMLAIHIPIDTATVTIHAKNETNIRNFDINIERPRDNPEYNFTFCSSCNNKSYKYVASYPDNMLLCPKHAKKCDAFNDCGNFLSKDYLHCKNCSGSRTCIDCGVKCHSCDTQTCKKCSVNLFCCDKNLCKSHVKTCQYFTCNNTLCEDHTKLCNSCGDEFCFDHISSTDCCSEAVCEKCAITCPEDGRLIDKVHSIECGNKKCKSIICEEPHKHNQGCTICSTIFCSKHETTSCSLCKHKTCTDHLLNHPDKGSGCTECLTKCHTCNTVNLKKDIVTCGSCEFEGCPSCLDKCHSCDIHICNKHSISCTNGPHEPLIIYCPECSSKGSHLHACSTDNCNQWGCQSHPIEICTEKNCKTLMCDEHIEWNCSECEGALCNEHGQYCTSCGKEHKLNCTSCNENSDEIIVSCFHEDCQEYSCNHHTNTCCECDNQFCQEHSSSTYDDKSICDNCFAKCLKCDAIQSHTTITQCEKCKTTYCPNCTTQCVGCNISLCSCYSENKSCSTCNKGTPLCTECTLHFTCRIDGCDSITCDDHSSICTHHNNLTCSEHLKTARDNKDYCTDCVSQCDACEQYSTKEKLTTCPDCNKTICEQCMTKCSHCEITLCHCKDNNEICTTCIEDVTVCEKCKPVLTCRIEDCDSISCSDHLKKCNTHDELTCSDHLKTAQDNKSYCIECVDQCNICNKTTVNDMLTACVDCGEINCDNCKSTCIECSKTICNSHLLSCNVCGTTELICKLCKSEKPESKNIFATCHLDSCKEILCSEHISICDIHNKVTCGDHITTPLLSQRKVCKEPEVFCQSCKSYSIGPFTNKICSLCNSIALIQPTSHTYKKFAETFKKDLGLGITSRFNLYATPTRPTSKIVVDVKSLIGSKIKYQFVIFVDWENQRILLQERNDFS